MPTVFLTNASTSPWTRPGDWTDAGHTVNILGCGGGGGITATGTSYRSGSGGGGGAHGLLTRTSGSLPATTDFTIFINSAVGANNSAALTRWGGTSSNTWQAGSGGVGAAGGVAGSGGTTLSLTGTFAVVYTSSQVNAGGAGGATAAVTGSAGGGGGAGGPAGVGGNGQPCITASRGGGGGGASNGGGSASATTSGTTSGGQGGGTGGAGGTSGVAAGDGGAGTGDGGGGGFFTGAVANVSGGAGGDEDIFTQTTPSLTAGPGGGGGGAGACSVNTAGATTNGGAGGNYGAGGGGAGGTRSATSTRTVGTGASGLIVITYTAGAQTHQGSAEFDADGAATATVVLRAQISSTVAAAGELVVDATIAAAVQHAASALLAGAGVLSESTPSSAQFEAWWNFASGAIDATGHGHDGTLHGTTLTTAPYGRNARSFNGTSDYIDGFTNPLDEPLTTTDFTLAIFANIPTASEKGCLIHVGAANGSDGYSLGVGDTTFDDIGNNLIFETCPNEWTVLGPIGGTDWKHLAAVVDSVGAVSGFIDGVPTAPAPGISAAAILAAAGSLTVLVGARRPAIAMFAASGSLTADSSAGPVLDADTTAWAAAVVAAGGTVSSGRKDDVDALIIGLKSDGVWTKLDRLWLFAAENTQSALIDLKARSTATNINATPFTPDDGYFGSAASFYCLDSNFNPSTAGGNYAQNSACFFAWSNTSGADNGPLIATYIDASTRLFPQYGDNNCYWGLNTGSPFTETTGGLGDGTGLWAVNRSAASAQQLYRNGSSVATGTVASIATLNSALLVLRENVTFGSRQVCAVGAGGSLNSTEQTALYNRLRTYMTSVGVP